MSFTRVNNSGWSYEDTLTSSQMNQLDINVSKALDKSVAGDTLSGAITVSSTGSLTLQSGSSIALNSGSTATINGATSLGAALTVTSAGTVVCQSGSTVTYNSGSTVNMNGTNNVNGSYYFSNNNFLNWSVNGGGSQAVLGYDNSNAVNLKNVNGSISINAGSANTIQLGTGGSYYVAVTNNQLQLGGGLQKHTRYVVADTLLTQLDCIVLADPGSSTINISLPSTMANGDTFTIKNVAQRNGHNGSVTVSSNHDYEIDGLFTAAQVFTIPAQTTGNYFGGNKLWPSMTITYYSGMWYITSMIY